MKRLMPLFCVLTLIFSLSACTEESELPTEIGDVGGIVVKDDDLIDQTEVEYNKPDKVSKPDNTTDEGECGIAVGEATADAIKAWMSPIVSGAYKDVSDEGDAYKREETDVNGGGIIRIISMDGAFYMLEFRIDKNSDIAAEQANKVLAAYAGYSKLPSPVLSELESAMSSVLKGGDIGYVESAADEGIAQIYIMTENDDMIVQIQ